MRSPLQLALGVYFTIWMVNAQKKKVLYVVALYAKCTRAPSPLQIALDVYFTQKKIHCIVVLYTKCTRALVITQIFVSVVPS